MAKPKPENDNAILATFRIDSQKWDQFKDKAAKSGLNATIVLRQFIDDYLLGEVGDNPKKKPNSENIDSIDKNYIDDYIKELLKSHCENANEIAQKNHQIYDQVIDEIRERVGDLESAIATIENQITNLEIKIDDLAEAFEKTPADTDTPTKFLDPRSEPAEDLENKSQFSTRSGFNEGEIDLNSDKLDLDLKNKQTPAVVSELLPVDSKRVNSSELIKLLDVSRSAFYKLIVNPEYFNNDTQIFSYRERKFKKLEKKENEKEQFWLEVF